jgi:hypothetical protein
MFICILFVVTCYGGNDTCQRSTKKPNLNAIDLYVEFTKFKLKING